MSFESMGVSIIFSGRGSSRASPFDKTWTMHSPTTRKPVSIAHNTSNALHLSTTHAWSLGYVANGAIPMYPSSHIINIFPSNQGGN
jgi:hypothetical protein